MDAPNRFSVAENLRGDSERKSDARSSKNPLGSRMELCTPQTESPFPWLSREALSTLRGANLVLCCNRYIFDRFERLSIFVWEKVKDLFGLAEGLILHSSSRASAWYEIFLNCRNSKGEICLQSAGGQRIKKVLSIWKKNWSQAAQRQDKLAQKIMLAGSVRFTGLLVSVRKEILSTTTLQRNYSAFQKKWRWLSGLLYLDNFRFFEPDSFSVFAFRKIYHFSELRFWCGILLRPTTDGEGHRVKLPTTASPAKGYQRIKSADPIYKMFQVFTIGSVSHRRAEQSKANQVQSGKITVTPNNSPPKGYQRWFSIPGQFSVQ